jgi:hypothetical protein
MSCKYEDTALSGDKCNKIETNKLLEKTKVAAAAV